MLDMIISGLLDGSPLIVTLKLAAVVAGVVVGVRLLAGGGRTADDRDRSLLDAVRRRRTH